MKLPLFILLFLLFHCIVAQNRHSIEIGGDYGEMILHSQDVRPMGPSSPYAFGLEYSYWLLKENSWKYCNCYPRIGLSLNYHNFDNPEILGFGFPVYGFLEPWYRLTPKLFFTIRGAAGYSWLSNPHHSENNSNNLSYSMHFTPFIMVGTGIGYKLNNNWRISGQIRYNHASNGGIREPNKGLNYPTAHLGISYSWKEIAFTSRKKVPLQDLKMKKYLNLTSFIAGKSIDATHVSYAVPGLEISYTQQIGRTSALTAGMEWISNFAYKKRIEKEGLDLDHNQVALLAGHRFLLGNFTFGQMIGVYLYRPYDIKPDWYQRYSLMWFPFKNFGIGTSLKAHGHVAEFLDVRLTYRYHFSSKESSADR